MSEGVLIALIGSGATVAVALLGLMAEGFRRHHKALSEVRDNSREAKEQVKNSHSTNLRDDIDDLHDSVRQVLDVLKQHGIEIGGLYSEMRHERNERLEVSRRLDTHMTGILLAAQIPPHPPHQQGE